MNVQRGFVNSKDALDPSQHQPLRKMRDARIGTGSASADKRGLRGATCRCRTVPGQFSTRWGQGRSMAAVQMVSGEISRICPRSEFPSRDRRERGIDFEEKYDEKIDIALEYSLGHVQERTKRAETEGRERAGPKQKLVKAFSLSLSQSPDLRHASTLALSRRQPLRDCDWPGLPRWLGVR